jgi:hypothetical protein
MKAVNRAGNLKRITTHERRRTRHTEALARQIERSKRSDLEQLALIAKRPGESKREKAKLCGLKD